MKKRIYLATLLALSMVVVLSSTSCKKKKLEKSNYMEIDFGGKNEQFELENLTIAVTHFNSTDTYSFTCFGSNAKISEQGTYPAQEINVQFSITNFTKNSEMNIEMMHISPVFRIYLSGISAVGNYGSYESTNSIGGKKGVAKVFLEVVDFEKKIIRARVEKAELWGQGWEYAHTIPAEKIYLNFVDFTIVEEE
jgi:hypothetical protein